MLWKENPPNRRLPRCLPLQNLCLCIDKVSACLAMPSGASSIDFQSVSEIVFICAQMCPQRPQPRHATGMSNATAFSLCGATISLFDVKPSFLPVSCTDLERL